MATLAQLAGLSAPEGSHSPEDLRSYLLKSANSHGIDPALAESVFRQESSSGRNAGVSPAGARGPMQLMPATFRQMMPDGNIDDPRDNIEAGVRYLKHGKGILGTDDPRLLAAGYYQGYNRDSLKRGEIVDTNRDPRFPSVQEYAGQVAGRVPPRRGNTLADIAGIDTGRTFLRPAAALRGAPPQTPQARNAFAYVNDFMINTGNAIAGLAKAGVDAFDPGGAASKGLADFIEMGRSRQSDWQKAADARLQGDLAGATSEWEKPLIYFRHALLDDPLKLVGEGLGNIGPFAVLGRTLQAARLSEPAAQKLVMGVAGLLGMGEVRGNIYDRIQQIPDSELRKNSPDYEALRATMSEKDAKHQFGSRFAEHLPELAATALVSALGGKYGLEGLAAKVGPKGVGRLGAGAIGAIDEGTQGAVEQMATNMGVARSDPNQELWTDVPLNAAMEGMLGGVGGLAAGGRPEDQRQPGVPSGGVSRGAPPGAGAPSGGIPDDAEALLAGGEAQPAPAGGRSGATSPPPGGTPDAAGAVMPSAPEFQGAAALRLGGSRSYEMGGPGAQPAQWQEGPVRYAVQPIDEALFEQYLKPSSLSGVQTWDEYRQRYPAITHIRLQTKDGRKWTPAKAPFIGDEASLMRSAPAETPRVELPETDDAVAAAAAPAKNPEQRPATPVAENQAPVAVPGEAQGDAGVAPGRDGGVPDSATKPRRGSREWRDEGKSADDLAAERADDIGRELAGTIYENSRDRDFAPNETPVAVRYWSEDTGVPEEALRSAVLKNLDRFDFSPGRKAQIVKALSPKPDIDAAANAAATSPENDLPQPTEPQKEAGNYQKGHIKLHGLDISIENPKGSERSGVGEDGKPWKVTMANHYGYIRRTEGADGDHVDTFVGSKPESDRVFVVDQVDPRTGKFDEHKVMLGFNTQKAARRAYLANYSKGWGGLRSITEMSVDEFKDWLKNGDTTKPLSPDANQPKPRRAKPERDSRRKFLDALRKMGGISSSEASDITGERGFNANRLAPGLFKKTGSGIDEIASRLTGLGYITEAEASDVDGGAERARELIRQALDGEQVYTLSEMDARARRDFEEEMAERAGMDQDEVAEVLDDLGDMEGGEPVDAESGDIPLDLMDDAVAAAFDAEGEFSDAYITDANEQARVAAEAALGIEPFEEAIRSVVAAQAEDSDGDAGDSRGSGAPEGQDGGGLVLAGQTEDEARAEAERLAAIERREKKDRDDAEKAERDAKVRKELEQRQRLSADSFALGQTPEQIIDGFAGQGGLLGADNTPQAAAPDFGGMFDDALSEATASRKPDAAPASSFERQIQSLRRTAGRAGWTIADNPAEDGFILKRDDGNDSFLQLRVGRVTGARYQVEVSTGARKAKRGVNALNVEGQVTEFSGHRPLVWDGERAWQGNELFSVLRDYVTINPGRKPDAAPRRSSSAQRSREERAPSDQPERSAAEAATSAAKNTAAGVNAALDGLGALFGGSGRLSSGLSFDEETYAKAVPLFKQAIANLGQAGADLKDMMRAIVRMLVDRFGPDIAQSIKPYAVRFMEDVYSGKESLNAERSGAPVEPDREVGNAPDTVGAEGVSDEPGGDDRGARAGGGGAEGAGRRRSGGRQVPGDEASPTGERGDILVPAPEEPPGPARDFPGSDEPQRGSTLGFVFGADAPVSAETVGRAATRSPELASKVAAQSRANKLPVRFNDKANIDETLPFLLDGQREDVAYAEARWSKPDGYGVLFTNGTGTGKTFLGLGAVRRMVGAGKKNVLIVVPDQTVLAAWVDSGKQLGLDVQALESTSDPGRGVSITTYANAGTNRTLADRDYDLVIMDESHNLKVGQKNEDTNYLRILRAITNHPDGDLVRARMIHRDLSDELEAARDKLERLGKIRIDDMMDQMLDAHRKEVVAARASVERLTKEWEEKLGDVKAQVAEAQGEKRSRVMFLSATPFAYDMNVDWANGYLFEYGAQERGGYNTPGPFARFMMTHFGYRMRYGKLTKPDANVNSDLMERNFNTWLRKQGVLSSRTLDVPFDYDRKFVEVDSLIGRQIDEGMAWLREAEGGRYRFLHAMVADKFDYLSRSRLLEAIKAKASVDYIKKHLALGRKVVVWYDFNEGGGFQIFNFSRPPAGTTVGVHVYEGGRWRAEEVDINSAIDAFEKQFPQLVALNTNLPSPLETLTAAFPQAMQNNGITPKAKRLQNIRDFNDDAKPGANLLLVQSAANAGWSGHDTTGKHMRVTVNLGLPTQPHKSTQQEGRTYRVGQQSDTAHRYFNTGTTWERVAFAQKVARRAGTVENLAMGEQARGLSDAFIQAFENVAPDEPGPGDGKGGKASDRALTSVLSEYERAIALYYAQEKRTGKTKSREGTDYFATPEPLGLKMVQWASPREGDAFLEPSGGHGAIARWFPENSRRTMVEASEELASRAALATDAKIIVGPFESHDIVNKYDVIVMNPPFGVGGKTAVEHLAKAAQHLNDGGRIVAILPRGPAADKRLEEFLYGGKDGKGANEDPAKNLYLAADIILPTVAFKRAGTEVQTHVVVLEKQTNPLRASEIRQANRDYSSETDIDAFFERIKDASIPERRQVQASFSAPPAQQAERASAPQAPLPAFAGGWRNMAQVTHVTKAGKTLRGVVFDIGKNDAEGLDPFTFKKNGGWFVRNQRLEERDGETRAEQPRTRYGEYTRDLFGDSLSGDGRSARDALGPGGPELRRDVQPAFAVPLRTRDDADGEFATRTLVTEERRESIPLKKAETAEDAARVFSYIARNAVERLDALITDKNGNVLALVGGPKGGLSETRIYTETILLEAFRIEGAANLWLGHNHPSGGATLSEADKRLAGQVRSEFRGSGIDVKGILAVARDDGGLSYMFDAGDGDGSMAFVEHLPEPENVATVAVTNRVISKPGKLREQQVLSSPSVMARTVPEIAGKRTGVVLLDMKLSPIAFVPLKPRELDVLRRDGRMDAIYRAVSTANAAAATFANYGGLMSEREINNVASLLETAGVRTLDVVNYGDDMEGRAWSTDSKYVESRPSAFFSRRAGGHSVSRAMRAKDIEAAIAQIRRAGRNLPPVVVVQSLKQLPRELQAAIRAEGSTVRGAFHNGTIYLVGDNLTSTADSVFTLLHEAAHFGLQGVFGAELKPVLMKIHEDNAAVRDAVAKLRADHPQLSIVEATEEALADMAGTGAHPTIVQRLVSWIRDWFRRRGIQLRMNDADVAAVIARARGFWARDSKRWTHVYSTSFSARPATGMEFAANVLGVLSESEELYQHPKSDKKTLAGIAADLSPAMKVVEFDASSWNMERMATVTMPDGAKAMIHIYKDGAVALDASLLAEGQSGGGLAYTLAATYAHNTEKLFIGDPNGLSDAALFRRTEHMIASAMKFGTTDHLYPHERQIAEGMEWEDGRDNLQNLLAFSRKLLVSRIPEIQDIVYNFEARRFERTGNGRQVTDADFETLAQSGGAREARAGSATLKRGAILNTLVRATSPEGRRDILAQALRQSGEVLDDDLRRTFYSRRPPPSPAQPAAANAPPTEGRFVSGVRQQAARILDRVRMEFDPFSFLPDRRALEERRYRLLGRIASFDEIASDIKGIFSSAAEEDQQAAYRYFLTPDADESMIPNPSVAAMAKRAKRLIESVGDALVERGLLSPEARDAHRGRYLPQVYLKFLLGDQNWRALGAGKKVSDQGYLKGRKLDRRVGPDGEVHVFDAASGERLDDEFLDAVLGPVRDPAYLSSLAIVRPMRDMAILDYLDALSQNTEWVLGGSVIEWRGKRVSAHWAKLEADRLRRQSRHQDDPDAANARRIAEELDGLADEALGKIAGDYADFRQIPDTTRYGRLRGIWVRKEIYDDLVGINEFIPADPGWAMNLLGYGGIGTRITQLWKAGKVGLNPPAQVRNFISNMVLLQLSGVPLHRIPTLLVRAAKQIRNYHDWRKDGGELTPGQQASVRHYLVALKYGVTESTFTAQELYRMERDLLEIEHRAGRLQTWGKIKLFAAAFMDKASDLYQFSEALGKTMKIMDEMERRRATEADAALAAQEALFDYSLVSQNVRYLRNAPLGMPFVTFSVKVLPQLLSVARHHPERFIPWVALAYGLPALVAAMLDVDDDDLEKLKKALPQWLQDRGHAYVLPVKDGNGRWQVVDLGYFFPWTAWTQPVQTAAQGEAGKTVQALGMFSGPLTDIIIAVMTGRDSFTGREIVQPGDPPQRQYLQMVNYMWSMAMPPIVTDHGAAGHAIRAFTGETNRWGDPLSSAGQAALRAVGVNLYAIHPETSRTQEIRRRMREIYDVGSRMRQRLQDRGLDADQRRDLVLEYRDEMRRRQEKLNEYMEKSEIAPELRTVREEEEVAP